MHSEATHRMFKIYFVLSTFLLGIGLAGYCILRLIQACQIFFNNLNDYLLHKLPLSRLAVPVEERRQRRVRPDRQTQTQPIFEEEKIRNLNYFLASSSNLS